MKRTLSVLICDYDQFYTNGLKLFLKEWFSKHQIDVSFNSNFQQRANADLIFISLSELSTYRAHALCMEMKTLRRNTFIIKNQDDYIPEDIIHYTQTIGTVVSRQARLTTMEDHLQQPLKYLGSSLAPPLLSSTSSVMSLRYRLTFRETQILRYLARGVSHATVARYSLKKGDHHLFIPVPVMIKIS